MASPRLATIQSTAPELRRYRRSAFNGAKQLRAAQAPNRRILILLALLALALVAALAIIIGVNLQSEQGQGQPISVSAASATHPANY